MMNSEYYIAGSLAAELLFPDALQFTVQKQYIRFQLGDLFIFIEIYAQPCSTSFRCLISNEDHEFISDINKDIYIIIIPLL